MLFSEPKIPQLTTFCGSISISRVFQCSSASRKFLNPMSFPSYSGPLVRFSALQRAENSSIRHAAAAWRRCVLFQCSSASRKFLNSIMSRHCQRVSRVSVLFSEPKIPQWRQRRRRRQRWRVSVLFSEPKIPQFGEAGVGKTAIVGFSALQRAENSSIKFVPGDAELHTPFQCSSASRKFLNGSARGGGRSRVESFSALQRAENSSIGKSPYEALLPWRRFSALQRAENSSIDIRSEYEGNASKFQCSSASRKFLNRNGAAPRHFPLEFQCSSASRKFLNPDPRTCVHPYFRPR